MGFASFLAARRLASSGMPWHRYGERSLGNSSLAALGHSYSGRLALYYLPVLVRETFPASILTAAAAVAPMTVSMAALPCRG